MKMYDDENKSIIIFKCDSFINKKYMLASKRREKYEIEKWRNNLIDVSQAQFFIIVTLKKMTNGK